MNDQANHTQRGQAGPRPHARSGFFQTLSSVAVGVALLAMMVVAGCDSGGDSGDSGNGDNGNGDNGDTGADPTVSNFEISDATPSIEGAGEVTFTYTVEDPDETLDSDNSSIEFGDGEQAAVQVGENLETDPHTYVETGEYTAEVILNGESAATVDFEVVGTDTQLLEDFEGEMAIEASSCCAGDGEIIPEGVNEDGEFEYSIVEVNGNWNNFAFTHPEGEDGDGFPVFERPTLQLDMAVDGDRDFPVRAGFAQGGGGVVQAATTDTVRYDVPTVNTMQTYYFDYSEETGIGLQNFGEPVEPDSVDGVIWELRFNFYDNAQPEVEEGKDPESWDLRVDNVALHTSRNPLAEPLE